MRRILHRVCVCACRTIKSKLYVWCANASRESPPVASETIRGKSIFTLRATLMSLMPVCATQHQNSTDTHEHTHTSTNSCPTASANGEKECVCEIVRHLKINTRCHLMFDLALGLRLAHLGEAPTGRGAGAAAEICERHFCACVCYARVCVLIMWETRARTTS